MDGSGEVSRLSGVVFSLIAKHQVVAYTEKSQDKHESRHIQLVREYGFHPRSKVQVEDGALLPRKFEPFPNDMYGRPLEEIDNFIYEEVKLRYGWRLWQGSTPNGGNRMEFEG
uniref:Uncharacterized protein n=1 Tax=Anopheles culicifacies TaxID=139723 RepID=A0A182MAI5_9DIPT